jgi:hypothetical protein
MVSGGNGFYYTGLKDIANSLILVTAQSSGGLFPYIVTETHIGGAPTDVVPIASFNFNTFKAKPVTDATQLFYDLTSAGTLNDVPEIDVLPTFLTGPLFTGCIFLAQPGTTPMATGGQGLRFRGTVVDALPASGAGNVAIVAYTNGTSTNRITVNVVANNEVGRPLVPGQLVIVDMMAGVGLSAAYANARWRISEFSCPGALTT